VGLFLGERFKRAPRVQLASTVFLVAGWPRRLLEARL